MAGVHPSHIQGYVNLLNAISSGAGERYAALLDLVRTLTSTQASAAWYAVVCGHARRAVPGSACAVGLAEGGGRLVPVHQEGEGVDWGVFFGTIAPQLRAGATVLRSGPGFEGTVLAVPLFHGEVFLGCIGILRGPAMPPFEAADGELMEVVGRLAGLAFRTGWMASEAERRGQEIELLAAAVRDLSSSLELEAVVERVASHAHQWLDAPVVVWLTEGERARAVARAGAARIRVGEERPLRDGVMDRLVDRAEPDGSGDSGTASEAAEPSLQGVEWFGGGDPEEARLVVPLVLGRSLIGLLTIGPWADAPERHRIRLLYRLAPHAASAIENARLHAELRRLSLTDPLSQLPNRRQLDLVLEREFAAALRGRSVCFILFDLDRFKEYNDAYGHREGDIALIRFAQILRAETRSMNLPARYGGEEFAAILSGTGRTGGQMHAERVRRRVLREFGGKLTVSAGVAEFRSGMATPHDLVVAADRALYQAKTRGRNRVCLAEG